MRGRASNWGAYQPGQRPSSPVGSRARRRQAATAARRSGEGTAPPARAGSWQWAKSRLAKLAVALAAAVAVGITGAVTGIAQDVANGAWHGVVGLFTDDAPPPKPTIASVTPLRINGGGTVVFAEPMHLSERQIEADTNSLTGPGVLPDDTAVQVMVRNPGHDTVYVTNVQVKKVCTAPLSGTVLFDPPLGSGGESDVGIGFDLDSPHPVPRDFSSDSLKLGGGYFLGRTVTILPGQPQTFLLYTRTSRSYCRFRFVMTVHVDDRTYQLTIDRKGKPFEITAGLIEKGDDKPTLGAYQVAYVSGYQAHVGAGAGMSATTPDFVKVDPGTWKQGGPAKR
jgi:hypothetical protein